MGPLAAIPSASGFDLEERARAQSNLEVDALRELAKTRCSIGAATTTTPLQTLDPMAVAVVESTRIGNSFRFGLIHAPGFGQDDLLTPRGSAEIEVVHQTNQNWQRLGSVEDLKRRDLQQLDVGHTLVALSYRNGEFGAVSGRCNHAGGPLGQGYSGTIISSAPGTIGCFIA